MNTKMGVVYLIVSNLCRLGSLSNSSLKFSGIIPIPKNMRAKEFE